jgi:hypothetical protein
MFDIPPSSFERAGWIRAAAMCQHAPNLRKAVLVVTAPFFGTRRRQRGAWRPRFPEHEWQSRGNALLVEAYYRIADPRRRRAVHRLIQLSPAARRPRPFWQRALPLAELEPWPKTRHPGGGRWPPKMLSNALPPNARLSTGAAASASVWPAAAIVRQYGEQFRHAARRRRREPKSPGLLWPRLISADHTPVSIALLETAIDRFLHIHDESDARDLIERA